MRRFVESKVGRQVSRVLILALVWNFVFWALPAVSGYAQIAVQRPQWAVLDFVNKTSLGGRALGGTAADAVAALLLTANVDVLGRETVERAYQDLGLTPPVTNKLDILRLGQYLTVEVVVIGEIQQAQIRRGANGRSADVALIVQGIDVSSGFPVVGTAVIGSSSERPGDITDDALLAEAVNDAAQKAMSEIRRQQIGTATVLATPSKFVKINMGARHGVKEGMRMVVTRQKEYVGIIRISNVRPDGAEDTVVESVKGVAPGDKARPIYDRLPEIKLVPGGGGKVRSVGKGGTSSALVAVLVLGLLALTLQKGSGGSPPGKLITEATVAEDGISPVVRARWHPDIFNLGAWNRIEWHLWRTDYVPTPVEVVPGTITQVLDRTAARTRSWRDPANFGGVGGPACVEDPGAEDFDNPAPGIVPGTTYMYQLSLIYRLSSLDVPGAGGGQVQECFFTTGRSTAQGPVTPLDPPLLALPENGSQGVGNIVQFSWQASPGADQYAVEISTTPTFSSRSTVRVVARVETLLGGLVSTDPINISAVFPTVERLYWRAGARNSGDVPGPVPDVLGERYVFSRPFQFDRVTPPPPPPPSE
ncbi:MAG: hypothetical protein K6T17_00970 [Fimbriimonadales bacterium]|nr:hypothetical protein [Fimbriimonadales bacterium]